jgi:predicted ATPase
LDLGVARIALGEVDDGVDLLTSGLDAWSVGGFELDRPFWLSALAEGHRHLGRLDAALAAVDEAVAHLEGHGERLWEAEVRRLRGELALDVSPEKSERVAETFEDVRTTARQQGARLFELRAALSLHRLRKAQGRARESTPVLTAVVAEFTEGFETPDLREARTLLDAASTTSTSGW